MRKRGGNGSLQTFLLAFPRGCERKPTSTPDRPREQASRGARIVGSTPHHPAAPRRAAHSARVRGTLPRKISSEQRVSIPSRRRTRTPLRLGVPTHRCLARYHAARGQCTHRPKKCSLNTIASILVALAGIHRPTSIPQIFASRRDLQWVVLCMACMPARPAASCRWRHVACVGLPHLGSSLGAQMLGTCRARRASRRRRKPARIGSGAARTRRAAAERVALRARRCGVLGARARHGTARHGARRHGARRGTTRHGAAHGAMHGQHEARGKARRTARRGAAVRGAERRAVSGAARYGTARARATRAVVFRARRLLSVRPPPCAGAVASLFGACLCARRNRVCRFGECVHCGVHCRLRRRSFIAVTRAPFGVVSQHGLTWPIAPMIASR